jgi:phosphatidate cytidylyltransferase
VTFIGTFGDLIESSIKRECEVKDIGDFLPGHGGILDRLDSLVILAPFAYFYVANLMG